MAIIIVVANHKGGIGKSTSVGTLGTIFAANGNKVLMVDLDTQANLTYSFIDIETSEIERHIYDAISERKGLPQISVKENLYLVPSGLEMTLCESAMYNMRRREYILQDLIRPIESKYDIIIFDCPPSLGLLTTNALTIADRLIIPMTADQLSYYGLKMMKAYIESMSDMNENLHINDVFFTMYDGREKVQKKWEPLIREEFGEIVMQNTIRRNVKTKEAVSAFCSIVDYMPDSPGAIDYMNVAKELMNRINNE